MPQESRILDLSSLRASSPASPSTPSPLVSERKTIAWAGGKIKSNKLEVAERFLARKRRLGEPLTAIEERSLELIFGDRRSLLVKTTSGPGSEANVVEIPVTPAAGRPAAVPTRRVNAVSGRRSIFDRLGGKVGVDDAALPEPEPIYPDSMRSVAPTRRAASVARSSRPSWSAESTAFSPSPAMRGAPGGRVAVVVRRPPSGGADRAPW